MGGHHHHHHGHNHGHHGHNCPSQTASRRRIAIAAILTGIFMVVEVWGGLISGSLALLADAGHMLTDFAALFLAWIAFYLSDKAANSRLNFGFARLPILAAFVNGLTLILIALWIVYEACHRFLHRDGHEILASPMLYVAIAGLVVNGFVFLILAGADRENLNVRGAILHVIGDMLGSAAAIIAALVIMMTGFTLIDPLLSIFVALLIAWSAVRLIKESGHILMQGAPRHLNVDELASKLIEKYSEITQISDLKIWMVREDLPVLTAKVHTDPEIDIGKLGTELRDFLKHEYQIEEVTLEILR